MIRSRLCLVFFRCILVVLIQIRSVLPSYLRCQPIGSRLPLKKKKKKRQLLNFVSCRVRENFNDFSKSCLWQILNYLSALVNSADVKYGVIPFFAWKIPSKFLLVLRHQRRGSSLTYIIHLFNGRSAAVMITIQSLQRVADSRGIET